MIDDSPPCPLVAAVAELLRIMAGVTMVLSSDSVELVDIQIITRMNIVRNFGLVAFIAKVV